MLASGASKRLKGVAAALRRRVDQYFPPVEGVYPPPEDTVLLDKLTDELLVVASDTVAASAAAYRASIEGLQDVPVFSGKAQLRLLAWLVADARGADKTLDKVDAEKVGKRLERQAHRVRTELAAARESAITDRARIETDGGDQAALAAVNAAEQAAFDHAHNEIYVGFVELEALMPSQASEEEEPAPVPAPAPRAVAPHAPTPADEATDTDAMITELYDKLKAKGVCCPTYILPHDPQEDRSMPPDLAAALGDEAAQELRDRAPSYVTGDDWWFHALPLLVKLLVADRGRLKRDHAADLDYEATRLREEKLRREEDTREISELKEEIYGLQDALERAKGREEALHAVIQRCRWG